jgi:hypothetical protein
MRVGDISTVPAAGQPMVITSGIVLPYRDLSDVLKLKLRQTEYSLDDTDQTIRIDRVTASDASGYALLAVETSGYLNGTMYFWGTPQLQSQATTGQTILAIPDLRMDAETRRALDSISSGLSRRVDQRLTPDLREASYVDLSDRLGYVQNAFATPYQMGDTSVVFRPIRLQPGQVYSTPQGLVTNVTMETSADAQGRFYIIQG